LKIFGSRRIIAIQMRGFSKNNRSVSGRPPRSRARLPSRRRWRNDGYRVGPWGWKSCSVLVSTPMRPLPHAVLEPPHGRLRRLLVASQIPRRSSCLRGAHRACITPTPPSLPLVCCLASRRRRIAFCVFWLVAGCRTVGVRSFACMEAMPRSVHEPEPANIQLIL
jgi:hypothetical protein